jgi:iron complex outermembrane receptor protein
VGLKYQGRVGVVPVRFNIAGYNQWVSNIQRELYVVFPDGNLGGLTANVPGAQVHGVDVDGEMRPFDWLRIGGAFAVTDAEYETPHTLTFFGQLADFDTFADIAKYQGSVYAQASLPVPSEVGNVYVRGEVYAQSSQYFSNQGKSTAPGTKLPGYHLVNFRVGWDNIARSHLSAALFVKNAFSQAYYVGGNANGSQLGSNAVNVGEPRFYGLELGYEF